MDTLIVFVVLSGAILQLSVGQHFDVQYEIEEESSNRKFGNIVQDSTLNTDFTSTEILTFTYRFLSAPPIAMNINEQNGDLNIVGRIDRDSSTVCPKQVDCSFQLDIVVSSGATLKAQKKINIIVKDINDNVPTFTPTVYKLEIPESARVSTSFTGLPTAIDNDSPAFGIKDYRLTQLSDTFALQKFQTNGLYDLNLVLLKKLDRENQDRYILKVNASDGSTNEGQLVVEILVKDSNDHAPAFNSSKYETSIKENLAIGTTILTVHAEDADIGLNGQVLYKFRSATQDTYGHLFGIHNTTGTIYTKGLIDYETTSIYHLVVVAQDRGSDSIPVDSRVTIHVIDQNDCIPEIIINTLTKSNTDIAEVPEEKPKGSFVAQLSVSDADSGDNGKVTCSLNDNVFTLEEVTPFEKYKIVTASALDREHHSTYNLAIVCKDKGAQPQTAIKQLKVDVLDTNDHNPIFQKASYLAEIYENNRVGASVITVSAVDDDSGPNAQITYGLSSDANGSFEINPANGTIKAKVSLDRETTDQISFHAIAWDNGQTVRLSSSVRVVINIKDINDKAPKFDEPVYTFHIIEESLPYSSVDAVYAKDPEPGNTVRYSLDAASQNFFRIDPLSGMINTLAVMDREVTPMYNVIVTAMDNGIPALSSTAQVNIILDDINDNEPVFKFPNETNNSVHISNRHPIGAKIVQIVAVDFDTGTYGHVTYKFIESVESDDFSIDALSGAITLIKDLSLVNLKEFNLAIQASDQGNPPKQKITSLKIVVDKSISLNPEESAILSKPNETAVIAVACVAALLIIPLVVGIVCICRHRNQLKSTKRQKWLKTLNFLTFSQQTQKEQSVGKAPNHPHKQIQVVNTVDTDQMIHNEDKLIRTSSVQDSGIDNMNMSWNSLNASQFQDERDNSSAEGSNADSGRGPSEAEENQSHIVQSTPSGRPERPPKLPQIGSQFDSPGRRLLYNTKTTENYHPGVHQAKLDCTRNHNLNRSFNSTQKHQPHNNHKNSHSTQKHQQPSSNLQRQYSQHYDDQNRGGKGQSSSSSSYGNDLQRSDSYPDRPVQYIPGRCSTDVYV